MMAAFKELTMARVAVVATTFIFSLLMAGCAMEETRTVHKGSLEQQFSSLNKNGWSVTTPDSVKRKELDPNVRIVKDADFSNLTLRTNFQVDDPKLKAQLAQREREEAAKRGPAPANNAPDAMPFGTLVPGR
jgi:hypothetical protein